MAIRTIFTLLIAVTLAVSGAAKAEPTSQMTGTVLAIDPAQHLATVRHEPFAGMPGMTMSFRLAGAALAKLHPGDRIDAAVDLSTDPWTILRARPAAAPAPAPKRVVPWVPQVKQGDLLPAARFVDQNGNEVATGAWRGRPLVLAFIYTRCRDPRMCPLISSKFHALQAHLAGTDAHLLEVTLDPEYDRGAVLLRYARTFEADAARWTLATGDPIDVLTFAKRFGIETERTVGNTIVHSERTAVVGRDGRIALLLDGNRWAPDDIIAELAGMTEGTGSPLATVRLELSQAFTTVCGAKGERTPYLVMTLAAFLVLGAAGRRAIRR